MRGEVAKQVQKEPGQLVLIFGGKILKDEDTLETHNIKDNNSVHLVIKNQRQVRHNFFGKIQTKIQTIFHTISTRIFRNQASQRQKRVRQHRVRLQVNPHHSHLVVLQRQASPVPIPLQVVNLSKVVFTSKRYF